MANNLRQDAKAPRSNPRLFFFAFLRLCVNLFRKLPPTLPGFALFLIAQLLLVRSLIARNAYEILLSSSALIFWLLLLFVGIWTTRRLTSLQPLWKPPFPLTAGSGGPSTDLSYRRLTLGEVSREAWQLSCQILRLPLFFRLHFLVRGRFFPHGTHRGFAVFAETSLPPNGETAGLSLNFPLGGLFQGETSSRLRDVFGFFSFPCGLNSKQAFNVRSAPCTVKPLRIEALSGAEDRRTKSSSDQERYYMREYAPGDLLRDINWKSSERIDTLITRISPDTQEKVSRIEIYFRNYGPSRPGIGDLWLLDRAKARLTWFLRTVKEEKLSFVFHIRSAGESWELCSEDEMEVFLEGLATIPFLPAQNEDFAGIQNAGDIYVFSTACDTTLPAFLLARQGKPPCLFLTQKPPAGKMANEGPAENTLNECARLRLRDFPAGGFFPFPHWFLPQPKRVLNAGGRAMIDYAEISL